MRLTTGLLLTAAAWAQSVGTASRSISIAPDEIVVDLVVATSPEALPDHVAGHLTALAITTRDLKSVGTLKDDADRLGWEFSVIRPFDQLPTTIKQLEYTRHQLRERGMTVAYQFFLRASPRSVAAAKKKVLNELIAEARRSAGSSGKLRSVTFEPAAENIDAARSRVLFGQPSGALQFEFSVVAVFEND